MEPLLQNNAWFIFLEKTIPQDLSHFTINILSFFSHCDNCFWKLNPILCFVKSLSVIKTDFWNWAHTFEFLKSFLFKIPFGNSTCLYNFCINQNIISDTCLSNIIFIFTSWMLQAEVDDTNTSLSFSLDQDKDINKSDESHF